MYNQAYDKIYDTAYNQAFIFYDEDEELCLDEFMNCAHQHGDQRKRVQLDLFAARLADRQVS